ncbi:MAG: threonine--tRNA ligase [Parachlamydiales bacterium]|nr:threonine--tRNA ligase [Parachlamydiales bacterium]
MKIYVNSQEVTLPEKATGVDLSRHLHLTAPHQALALQINGKNYDLTHVLQEGDQVTFLSFEESAGKEIFWHTSAHLLAQAVLRLWPKALPTIGPAIEHGFYYDFGNLHISEEDFSRIEQEMKKIIEENAHPERKEYANKKEALQAFSHNPFKQELIESFTDEPISYYVQGDFYDLCRGPHLLNMGKIKAFKLLKTSGAYWRGDQSREMLTRIYGISFPDKKLLKEYLDFLQEAKERDHRLIGKQLDLFSLKEEGPGMPFIHPKGLIIWETLLSYLRSSLKEQGYMEIKTPIMLSKELWERSGHWYHYRENMYVSEIENRQFAIKPMNCPGCMLFYKTHLHSYRELPLRVSEIGHVHRHEASGALSGLFRVRSFHQDDAHVFMSKDQIKDEILNILSLADKIYMTFGLSYKLELSTRPEKSKTIGSDEDWELATSGLQNALEEWGHSYKINEGDGAFYGPKIDVHIRDALGRYWQCGTIQLDLSFPEKFDLTYIDSDGSHKRPIMIHRTIYGSIERFFGVLIEHFSGKFPLWLSPHAVRIIPVADRHLSYAQTVLSQLKDEEIPVDIDDSHDSVSKKVRNAQLQKINYMITVGDKEATNNTIALRTRDNVVHGEMSLTMFIEKIREEKNNRALMSPFSKS